MSDSIENEKTEKLEGTVERARSQGWAGDFVHTVGHTVIQCPIDGVREVVNTMANTEVIPKVELIKPPPQAEIGSPEWQAQKAGFTAAVIGSVFVIGELMRRRRPF